VTGSLFVPADRAAIEGRIRALPADAQRQWGKMDAPAMMAHCSLALEVATGDLPMKQKFIGRILGPFFRGAILGPKPFGRNAPTGPELVPASTAGFEAEKARLLGALDKFCASGPGSASLYTHGFLGRLTGEEWGRLMHKHLDHHLTQFGG
jgi:hypothetical protein